MSRLPNHSARQAWIKKQFLARFRKHRPELYTRIRIAAARSFPLNRYTQWNLMRIVLLRVMQLYFTDDWLAIMQEGDRRFGCKSRPSTELARIAWQITLAIGPQARRKAATQ